MFLAIIGKEKGTILFMKMSKFLSSNPYYLPNFCWDCPRDGEKTPLLVLKGWNVCGADKFNCTFPMSLHCRSIGRPCGCMYWLARFVCQWAITLLTSILVQWWTRLYWQTIFCVVKWIFSIGNGSLSTLKML